MTDRIKSGLAATAATTATAPAEPYTPEVAEDDEYFEDGLASAEGAGSLHLPVVGSTPRPNGTLYKSRMIGAVEDIAFLRAMRERKRNALFYGPPGTGKLLPLDTPIPTPTGWTVMGDLQPGDEVLGRDGLPVKVSFVSDIDPNPVLYKITFSDQSSVIACADHRWIVSSREDRVATRNHKAVARTSTADRAEALGLLRDSREAGEWLTLSELLALVNEVPDMPWSSVAALGTFLTRSGLSVRKERRELCHSVGRTGRIVKRVSNVRVVSSRAALDVMASSNRQEFHWTDDFRERVLTTQEMVDAGVTLEDGRRKNFAVRLVKPLDLPVADLPVDPYVLGAWLGDGHVNPQDAASITSADPQVINEIVRAGYDLLGMTCDLRGSRAHEFSFEQLGADLRRSGITDKRIPVAYLRASAEQRLALLQGLMDTDGSVSRNGTCELTLSDDALARDAQELIRTLGIKVNRRVAAASYRAASGEVQSCKDRHRMVFTTTLPVFRMPRKARRLPSVVRETQKWVYIESIRPVESRPGKCIQVDNADHSYLCGTAMIPTHNTALAEAAFFPDALALDSDEAKALIARAEALGVKVAPASETYLHFGFESIVCGADTAEPDFYGTFVPSPVTGTHEFWAGPLLRAVLFDVPIYADEVFLCDSRVLSSTLYPLMDGRGVLRITMNPMLPSFPVGSGFFVVAAGNPNAPGATYSEALRSRFAHQIEVGTDWVLAKELGVPQEIITIAKNLDRQRREGSLSASPQLRELLDYRDDLKDLGKAFAVNSLLGKTPFEDRDVVQEALKAKFASATPLALAGRSGK